MSSHKIFYTPSGEIYRHTNSDDIEPGEGILVIEEDPGDPFLFYVEEGVLIPKGAQPSDNHVFDYATKTWVDPRTLADYRLTALTQLKAERDLRIESGFVWDGSVFDSDIAVSQPRILGLFTTYLAGAFPVAGQPWRLADNSWRTVFSEDMPGIWGALQAHLSNCFSAFSAHEATILSLTDIELLQNYDFQTGWPA